MLPLPCLLSSSEEEGKKEKGEKEKKGEKRKTARNSAGTLYQARVVSLFPLVLSKKTEKGGGGRKKKGRRKREGKASTRSRPIIVLLTLFIQREKGTGEKGGKKKGGEKKGENSDRTLRTVTPTRFFLKGRKRIYSGKRRRKKRGGGTDSNCRTYQNLPASCCIRIF